MGTIAPHASSPAVATGDSTTAVTATFSPPADTLLVACVFALEGNAATITVANSGTPRTWTQRARRDESDAGFQNGLAAIFTAPNSTALTNTTVTATTNFAGIGVKVYVLTGADLASPVGATGEGSSTTNAITPNAYTSTVAGSHGIACASELSDAGVPTSTDDEAAAYVIATGLAGMGVTKAADTATAGTVVTFNFDASGTGAATWQWCAVEIKPGASDASAPLTTVTATTSVPSPSVSAGSSAVPATVTATTAVPAPSMSAGASATPATVTATVTVPTPAVTTDTATTVTPTTVTAVTTVPAPAVAASASVQPATVTAAVAVYPLDVVAEFNASITLPHIAVTTQVDGAVASVPILPGDLLDGLPGQIEWNGFRLGRGTPYRWLTLDGWRGKDTPDSGNAPKATQHGSSPGRPLGRERALTLTGLLRVARDEVEQAVLDLENATPLLGTATQWPLVINDLGTPYLAYGRIDRVNIPLDKLIRLGLGKIVLQWILADPRRYNINATGVTILAGQTVPISNAGNADTHPLLLVPGPAVTPRIHNLTLNRVIEFNLTLADGEELVINPDLGTAKIGDTSVMSNRSSGSVSVPDWVLARGPQDVEYTTASGGTQIDVLYRDAWN